MLLVVLWWSCHTVCFPQICIPVKSCIWVKLNHSSWRGLRRGGTKWPLFSAAHSFLFWQLRCLFLFCMFVETIGATEILCRWILQLNSNRGATNNTITVETGTLHVSLSEFWQTSFWTEFLLAMLSRQHILQGLFVLPTPCTWCFVFWRSPCTSYFTMWTWHDFTVLLQALILKVYRAWCVDTLMRFGI